MNTGFNARINAANRRKLRSFLSLHSRRQTSFICGGSVPTTTVRMKAFNGADNTFHTGLGICRGPGRP
ncbi:Uncharacterised protein [Mycobacteroides abscessus subsp. abscessus]|nr:Uncharacterised protein [Mycobacteroides abscessus subsp. abscessus]